uniref:Uncharacterized protein n=1 Tax=uncultured marine thaumarchaeote SAT1000_13_B06 TaxID=1456381 RepID=A0A075I8W7_9ARCH|nr:hypothetical protein [uncultured marine thaumarchaeote SAT1000_13_B06]
MGGRKNLGVLAENKKQVINAIKKIKQDYNKYQESLQEFSKNFDGNGAKNTSRIVSESLEKTNSGLEILIFSPVRGMFDGRTDLTG